MNSLISSNQSASLQNRNILYRVVIIKEVVDFAKKKRKESMILKVDFKKAYDKVNWKFLNYMMGRFGMEEKWRLWIKECTLTEIFRF